MLRGSRHIRQTGTCSSAGHRPYCHDPIGGTVGTRSRYYCQLGRKHLFLFAVASVCPRRLSRTGIPRRNPLRLHGLFPKFSTNAGAPRVGILANGGEQQGRRQGSKALRAGAISRRKIFRGFEQACSAKRLALHGKSCCSGSLLSLLGTIGYYGSYTFVIYLAVQGKLTIGTLTFLAGAIAGASANIQMLFSTFSTIADQALFLTEASLSFSRSSRKSPPRLGALPVPRPIRRSVEFRDVVSVLLPRETSAQCCATSVSRYCPGSAWPWSVRTAKAKPQW